MFREIAEAARGVVSAPKPASSVLELLTRAEVHRFNVRLVIGIILFGSVVFMYTRAIYAQSAVIKMFQQPFDTQKDTVRQQAVLLGALLSPQRIALLCEYPALYSLLGYTSPYTGPVVSALVALDPSVETAVSALMLLESGLVVDTTKTSPPTLFGEVVRNLYPADTFKAPPIIHPVPPVKEATNLVKTYAPLAMNALFFLAMFA